MTHGDLALDVKVDFLAVVEHRLILARVRSEWARLTRKSLASVWVPACQESSHVGNAGVGVISMRGLLLLCLPLLLPSLSGSLILVGRFGACFHLVLVGLWRCSMGALPLEPLEGMSGSSKNSLSFLV